MRKFRCLFVLVGLLFCLPVSGVFAQRGDIDEIKLIDIDAADFPDVSVSFQAVDSDGVPVDLRSSDVAVYEDGEEVTDVSLREGESVPTNILFLVDLGGQYSNLSSIEWEAPDVLRNAFTQFVDEQFNEGIDTLSLYTTREQGTGLLTPLLEGSTSGTAFVNAVNSINFEIVPNGESYFAMRTASGTLNSDNLDQANLALVYIGDMHTSGQGVGAQTLLNSELPNFIEEQLLPNNIRFYALHTVTGDKTFTPHLQLLANSTGGVYVELSQQVGNDVRVDNLYDQLSSYGSANNMIFRSQSGTDEQREVVIVQSDESPGSAESELRYEIDIQPPTIKFSVPDDVTRNQQENGSFDENLLQLAVEVVNWPDGHERKIDRVQLFVDGTRDEAVNRPTGNRVELPLDLKVYEESGKTSTSLRVVVEDELGVEAEASDNLIVDVVYQTTPPPKTPRPEDTPVPIVTETDEPLTPDIEPRSVWEIISAVSSLLALLLVGLFGLLLFRFRNQVGQAGRVVGNVAKSVSQTILGGAGSRRQNELAKVKIVTAREDLRGQEVSIYEHVTRFGRNPQICDIQLFDEDDKSSVSGQHCTLQYDPGKQCFFLTDDNSSVGTFINGNPIAPNDPIRLQVGDEIVLGELVRRGAKLKLLSIANDLPVTQHDNVDEDGLLGTIYEDDIPALFGKTERDEPLSEAFSPRPSASSSPVRSNQMGSGVMKKPSKKSSSDSRQTILETTADSEQIHVPDTTTQIYPIEEESADWMDDLE